MLDEKEVSAIDTSPKGNADADDGVKRSAENADGDAQNGIETVTSAEPTTTTTSGILLVRNATAKWLEAQNSNSLENVNLKVASGRLVAIIGPVGAGKVCALEKTKKFNLIFAAHADTSG